MTNTPIQPVSQNNRTAIVDVLRGWALFIVVTMNFMDFIYVNAPKGVKQGKFEKIFTITESYLFHTKGWLLLAVLFGYGFAFLINKLEQREKNVVPFFLWRMIWLFVIGIFNSLIFGGDILLDYAIMGVLLLFFHKMNTKTLWYIIGSGILICPFLDPILFGHSSTILDTYIQPLQTNPTLKNIILNNLLDRFNTLVFFFPYSITVHIMQLVFFLLGLILFRLNFFTDAKEKYYGVIKKVFWISLVCFLLTAGISVLLNFILLNEKIYNYISLRYIIATPGMLMFATGIMLLFLNNKCEKITNSMQYIGMMTLTNYLTQNIIMFILFSILKLYLTVYWNFILAILIYILQVFFSKWWLSKYNYGFVEWIWRCLCYRQMFILKKNV
jgi:uncharacterized protein